MDWIVRFLNAIRFPEGPEPFILLAITLAIFLPAIEQPRVTTSDQVLAGRIKRRAKSHLVLHLLLLLAQFVVLLLLALAVLAKPIILVLMYVVIAFMTLNLVATKLYVVGKRNEGHVQ